MTPEIIPATDEHAHYVSQNLREADRQELAASSTKSLEEILTFSLVHSLDPKTAVVDGEPVLMFGAATTSAMCPVGHPWMLTTTLADRWPLWIGKMSKRLFLGVCEPFSYVYNYVDARHETAVRWIRWLGFNVLDPEPWGPAGMPFHKFEMFIQKGEVRIAV